MSSSDSWLHGQYQRQQTEHEQTNLFLLGLFFLLVLFGSGTTTGSSPTCGSRTPSTSTSTRRNGSKLGSTLGDQL